MTLQEHINKIKETIKDTEKKVSVIMEKALKEGKTPEGEDEETIKGHEAEIENLKLNLKRLENLQKSQADWNENTTPVDGGTSEKGLDSTQGKKTIEVKSNLPAGIGFAQFARAKFAAQVEAKKGNYVSPLDMAKQLGFNQEVQDLVEKATVGSTSDPNFAAALVQENRLVGEFVNSCKQQLFLTS